jgi:hypothetical protein
MLFVQFPLDQYAKKEIHIIYNSKFFFIYILQKSHQHVVEFHVHQHEVVLMDQVDHKMKELIH